MPRKRLSNAELLEGIRAGNRGVLARAITLVESRRPTDQQQAQQLLQSLLPFAGGSTRLRVEPRRTVGSFSAQVDWSDATADGEASPSAVAVWQTAQRVGRCRHVR